MIDTQKPDGDRCSYRIPHHGQETSYTCGPASFRMMIEALTERAFTESEMVGYLKTDRHVGTPFGVFCERLDSALQQIQAKTGHSFESRMDQHGTAVTLRNLLHEGFVVALNYTTPSGIPHYGVLNSIATKTLCLQDPHYGENHKVLLDEFNWTAGIKTPTTGAYIAIRLVTIPKKTCPSEIAKSQRWDH